MNNKKIQELFSAPIGLEAALKIDGTTFYSSQKLKDNFVLAFKKSSKGKHVSSEIESLVQKNVVIPCYKSKNLFSFIKKKLTQQTLDKYILGFYHIADKKVVIIIDNSISIFGTSSNNELASTTLHECMHLVAGKNLPKFVQVALPKLRAYYSALFTDYFELKSKPGKKADEVIKFISKYERRGMRYTNNDLSNYFRLLESLFKDDSNLQSQDFQIRLTNYIVAAKLFILSMQSLFKNRNKFAMLFTSLNKAYQVAFGTKNKYTTPIQEVISLSEVVCVLAEMQPQDPVIKKLFKIIA